MPSVFDGCTEACGWTAALISVICFGSFGVPIKSAPTVHPFVLQTYKTFVCFITCWCVIFMGESVEISPYGILSGLFWVPGAAAGIYGIRTAGLAVAVGTWSSITVLTSFVFGIIVFQEKVRSIPATAGAFLLLAAGLVGMARYSAPSTVKSPVETSTVKPQRIPTEEPPANTTTTKDATMPKVSRMQPLEVEPLVLSDVADDDALELDGIMLPKSKSHNNLQDAASEIQCIGLSFTRRQTGLAGAIVNGTWGGLNLIPLHYAMLDGYSGAGYLISYGVGSAIVNSVIWAVWYGAEVVRHGGSFRAAAAALPSLQLRAMWWPGMLAGLLYSTGNFGSILAVAYLGQGTGFSVCMMQLFVSGLWGVFYFGEIRKIAQWFASAAVAVAGIMWLSYEHQGGSLGH